MIRDLTVGKPQRVLPLYCLPLLGSILFQQLYNIADSLIAGKCIGEDALAAVGNSYEITLVFLAFAMGCNIGCSVVIARLFGGKRFGDVRTAVHTSLLGSSALCGLLMLLGLLFSVPLLRMLNTPDNVFADSALYLNIYIYGLPFVFLYNVATGIFTALGDSRTPFLFLACSSTANIGMDFLFVSVFRMGVAGLAWATFLCQGISCVLAVFFLLFRLRKLPEEESRIFSFSLLGEIGKIAVPSILQQCSISVGNVLIQRVINGFASGVMAGYSAAIKLNNLFITSANAFATAGSNFTAQNVGAGKPERVRAGYFTALELISVFSLSVAAVYLIKADSLVRFFIRNPSADAVASGTAFLYIVAPFYVMIAAKLAADGVLRGTGRMKQFLLATFTDLVIRVILSYLFSGPFGYAGIWASWPIGWFIAFLMATFFCVRCKEMKKRTPQTAAETKEL